MHVLLTGASSGIGEGMAQVFAEAGWDLTLVARRRVEPGIYSGSPPSIACAPVTGDNCIAVLVEPAAEYRLRWFRFSWNAVTGFHFAWMYTEPTIIWNGAPQVSVYRVGSSYEYVVTYLQSLNTTTYAWVLRMPITSGAFSFWGQALATTMGVPTHVANGSTRDLEMLVLSN